MRFLYVILICLLSGCAGKETFKMKYDKTNGTTDVTYFNIERIFMHQPDRFTLLVSDKYDDKTHLHCIMVGDDIPTDVIVDVPIGGQSWATKFYNGTCYNFIIHVKSADEIYGAGWQD